MKEEEKLSELRISFENRKDIAKLIDKYNKEIRNYRLASAMEIKAKIDAEWKKEAEFMMSERKSLYDAVDGMSEEDKETILAGIHAMLYVSDAFMGLFEEVNATLRKKDRFAKLDAFQKLGRLFNECENEVKFLLNGCSLEYQIGFATRSDEVREMIMDYTKKAIAEGNERFMAEAELSRN